MEMLMPEKDDFLVLLDEEGNEHEFEVIDFLQVNDKDYVILTSPVEEDFEEEGLELEWDLDDEMENSQEVVIFRIVNMGEENQFLIIVEDEAEWQNVVDAWETLA